MENNSNKTIDLSLPHISSEMRDYYAKIGYFPKHLLHLLNKRAGIDLHEMSVEEAAEKFIEYYLK